MNIVELFVCQVIIISTKKMVCLVYGIIDMFDRSWDGGECFLKKKVSSHGDNFCVVVAWHL